MSRQGEELLSLVALGDRSGLEIISDCAVDIAVYAAPEPYEDFEDEADAIDLNGYPLSRMGSLSDPAFLRRLADFIERCEKDDRVGALHLDLVVV
jgi:hypothetical protein